MYLNWASFANVFKLFSLWQAVLGIILSQHGAGRHLIAAGDLEDLKITVLAGFLARLAYLLVLWTTKLAICSFYGRVFQDKWSRIFVWTMMGVLTAYSLPLFLAAIFQCRPIEGKLSMIHSKQL